MIISRKYEVVGHLGQGGMGTVYKVRHTALDTISALKVLPAHLMEHREMVDRFYREARIMARMHHPNIVRVVDIDRDDALNLYYFVMEYIEGVTLSRYVREKGPLPLLEVLDLSRRIADALAYAHHHNPPVIHRDIKPANVMIENRSSRVVVMDFGIAKELGDGDATKTGMTLGTLRYAAPEQLRQEQLDGSADVYSLGMVIYELYTGKQFFSGLDEFAVLEKVRNDNAEHPPLFDRPVPPAFAQLLTRAIAKDRTQRYHSMYELLQAIDECRKLQVEEEDIPTIILPLTEDTENINPQQAVLAVVDPEQLRQQAREAQQQALSARKQAESVQAERYASELFRQGLEAHREAERQLQSQAYGLAISQHQRAAELWRKATETAQIERGRQEAEAARQQAETARTMAEQAGVDSQLTREFTQAQQLFEQGREKEAQLNFVHAKMAYVQAVQEWRRLTNEALRDHSREKPEIVRMRAAKTGQE